MAGREHDRERRRRRTENSSASSARRPERARRKWQRPDRTGAAAASSSTEEVRSARDRSARDRSETTRRGTPGTRSRRPTAGPGGAFKLSSTRRAALLAIIACALTLSIAVPLRNYWSQKSEMQAETEKVKQLNEVAKQLEERKTQLSDPTQIEAEARRRLRYVRPGETPYVVQLPQPSTPAAPAESEQRKNDKPWYDRLWDSITGSGS
ncbi:FtsB family cell division protein [Crossiella cryophila]|uniref:Cell division protein FtsB n=1 Tax=Crossiella cryophila TaxID=43355 RepID=A0A7W7C6K5_9PSEU|nr:septum formation initiator family protein [Crossiella cryophila]MBB4674164.1 cell division protein FtsB [Crossiella cryophila]